MIDIKIIREQRDVVQKAARDKRVDIDVAHLLEIDVKYQELSSAVQKLREERNAFTESIQGKPTKEQMAKGRELKERVEKEEARLKAVEEERKEWLYKIPNLPRSDVKVGKDDSENDVIKTWKELTKFSFAPKD